MQTNRGTFRLETLLSLFLLVAATAVFPLSNARAQTPFPLKPDARVTKGALCQKPKEYRYAEQIPYCDRNVRHNQKERLIEFYDSRLGYRIQSMSREEFKIDHLIPLCMGGSNEPTNLWPQHRSLFEITDTLEQALCEKMEMGRLRQKQAIELILKGKNDVREVPGILRALGRL